MSTHVAIAGIKEHAAAEDRAKHQHGHGFYRLQIKTKRFLPVTKATNNLATPYRDRWWGNIGMHRLHREMGQANKSETGEVRDGFGRRSVIILEPYSGRELARRAQRVLVVAPSVVRCERARCACRKSNPNILVMHPPRIGRRRISPAPEPCAIGRILVQR